MDQESDGQQEVDKGGGANFIHKDLIQSVEVENIMDSNEKDVLDDHHDESAIQTSDDEDDEEIEQLKANIKWLKTENLYQSKQHLSDMQKLRDENKWKLSIMNREKVFFI